MALHWARYIVGSPQSGQPKDSTVVSIQRLKGRVNPKTPRLGQPKDIKFVFAASPVNHIIKSNSKDWLAQNQDNVYEWRELSICRLLFQWASTIIIEISVSI